MLFSNPVLFELPALPRVAKFIRSKLRDGQGNSQPMLLHPSASGPGLLLWAMCQSRKESLMTGWNRSSQLRTLGRTRRIYYPEKEFSSKIGVGICAFHQSRHQYLLNYPELCVFSSWVDYIMQNELVLHCQQAPDEPPMNRIKAWCDSYDFSPDEFSESAARQMYLRYRKQLASPSQRAKVSSSFAPEVMAGFQFIPVPVSLAA